jgi:hypothetical protein
LSTTDAHPARIVQTVSDQVDTPTRAIQELHLDFLEIVLAELSTNAFETQVGQMSLEQQGSY